MITRRRLVQTITTALAMSGSGGLGAQSAPVEATPFSREALLQRMRDLAAQPYQPRAMVPADWQNLSYDQYRGIRIRHDRAVWWQTETPYRMEMFPPGLYWPTPVRINVVSEGMSRPVTWAADRFLFTDIVPPLSDADSLGYSGFRLSTEIDHPGSFNEFLVMQGASYFRAIGEGQIYGLSARGIAIDTGQEAGEEFPDFVEFWVEEPAPGQRDIIVHALLDGPSVAGLYRFDVKPGASTVIDVSALVLPRRDLGHVGIAPLTSMFKFDETNRHRFDDFRPAVHDSDGLMIRNGAGETLWRPLANPKHLQMSLFLDNNPRGFGLMQRARSFDDFADLEALYHKRPGLWIEPQGDWGRGSVTLVEIPTDREIYDNIVAYWLPEGGLSAGAETELAYRMIWADAAPDPDAVTPVLNTRMGARYGGGIIVTVDFANHALLPEALDDLTTHITVSTGSVTPGIIQRNPSTGGPRLAFTFDPGDADTVELRAQLRHEGRLVSEVWLYRWTRS